MRGKNVPESLSKTSVKHNTFARHFFHTFFIRFSDPFSRARAFYNFTFMRKFSHHMLDISTHTYVLDLFFTRTSWTLFHTCILDMFSHPYFWPPCPIPLPSRGDLGLICSVEAFSVHLQTVELHCGSIPKTYKHIQSQYRQIIHRPKGPWHIIHQLGRPLAVCGVMWVVPHFIAQWCIAQFPAHWVHSTVWPSNLSRKSFLFGKRARTKFMQLLW